MPTVHIPTMDSWNPSQPQESPLALTGPETCTGSCLEFTEWHCSTEGVCAGSHKPETQAATASYYIESSAPTRLHSTLELHSLCISTSLKPCLHTLMPTQRASVSLCWMDPAVQPGPQDCCSQCLTPWEVGSAHTRESVPRIKGAEPCIPQIMKAICLGLLPLTATLPLSGLGHHTPACTFKDPEDWSTRILFWGLRTGQLHRLPTVPECTIYRPVY